LYIPFYLPAAAAVANGTESGDE